MNINIALLVKLRKYICKGMHGRCSMERGGALTHKHFQMIANGNFTSLQALNKKIKVCLGWDGSPPTGHEAHRPKYFIHKRKNYTIGH
jgi:hypothetical protein